MRFLFAIAVGALLSACASSPDFDTTGVVEGLTPKEAVADFPATGKARVLWGGVIVDGRNRAGDTLLEILAYPLDGSQRPETSETPQGRFLAREQGYLELTDYGPGRRVTLSGRIADIQEGRVGEAAYRYPVIDVGRLHLWPRDTGYPGSRVHFGVGIIFSN